MYTVLYRVYGNGGEFLRGTHSARLTTETRQPVLKHTITITKWANNGKIVQSLNKLCTSGCTKARNNVETTCFEIIRRHSVRKKVCKNDGLQMVEKIVTSEKTIV